MPSPDDTTLHSSLHGFLSRASSRALVPYLIMGLFLVIALVVVGREIEHHLNFVAARILAWGPWGPLAFLGLFILASSLLMPESMLSILAGMVFGLTRGLAFAVTGSLLAAVLQFALAHRLLRTRIQRALRENTSLACIQRAVREDEVRLQVLLRLTPLNPAAVSYLLGATGVRLSGFLQASLAIIPHVAIEVYIGYAGKHVALMAGRHAHVFVLRDAAILTGLAVTCGAMIWVSRVARRALMNSVSRPSPRNHAAG